jgi:hypothetical protein
VDTGATVAPASPPPVAGVAAAPAPISVAAVVPTRGIALRSAPDAQALGTVAAGTPLTPLARERGWVRVRVEGWVPERDVVAADTALRSPLSAADIRSDPAGTRGKVVRWEVEVLSLQKADPLRRDLAQDEPYLLARGPGKENAILYLAVPPSLVETARNLAARVLAHVTVTARVRNGRSEPVGVPILDILAIGEQ